VKTRGSAHARGTRALVVDQGGLSVGPPAGDHGSIRARREPEAEKRARLGTRRRR
jgi:hypothetical protein